MRVRITGEAFVGLCSAYDGPQMPAGSFDQHRHIYGEIVGDKLLAGDLDDGVVVVTGADMDM